VRLLLLSAQDLDKVVQSISCAEKFFIGGDLNGHVCSKRIGFESIHGSQGFRDRNEVKTDIFNFTLAYDLTIANT
jgi:hypothetical protein